MEQGRKEAPKPKRCFCRLLVAIAVILAVVIRLFSPERSRPVRFHGATQGPDYCK